jgi:DNA-binding CsgD family transcriptional regulator
VPDVATAAGRAALTDATVAAYAEALRGAGNALVQRPEVWEDCERQARAVVGALLDALSGTRARQGYGAAPDPGRARGAVDPESIAFGYRYALRALPAGAWLRASHLLFRSCQETARRVGAPDDRLHAALAALHADLAHRTEAVFLGCQASALRGDRTPAATAYAASAPPAGALTAREAQVMALVAEALSNRQIGRRLEITEGTVKRHLRNIFRKLGAASRIEAVNLWRANGGRDRPAHDDADRPRPVPPPPD